MCEEDQRRNAPLRDFVFDHGDLQHRKGVGLFLFFHFVDQVPFILEQPQQRMSLIHYAIFCFLIHWIDAAHPDHFHMPLEMQDGVVVKENQKSGQTDQRCHLRCWNILSSWWIFCNWDWTSSTVKETVIVFCNGQHLPVSFCQHAAHSASLWSTVRTSINQLFPCPNKSCAWESDQSKGSSHMMDSSALRGVEHVLHGSLIWLFLGFWKVDQMRGWFCQLGQWQEQFLHLCQKTAFNESHAMFCCGWSWLQHRKCCSHCEIEMAFCFKMWSATVMCDRRETSHSISQIHLNLKQVQHKQNSGFSHSCFALIFVSCDITHNLMGGCCFQFENDSVSLTTQSCARTVLFVTNKKSSRGKHGFIVQKETSSKVKIKGMEENWTSTCSESMFLSWATLLKFKTWCGLFAHNKRVSSLPSIAIQLKVADLLLFRMNQWSVADLLSCSSYEWRICVCSEWIGKQRPVMVTVALPNVQYSRNTGTSTERMIVNLPST